MIYFPSAIDRDQIFWAVCQAFSSEPAKRQELLVQQNGTVLAKDPVSGDWTTCHALRQSAIAAVHRQYDMRFAPKFRGKDYVIVLDASFDLHEGGLDNSPEAQDWFRERFEEAAAIVADRCGIEIQVIPGAYVGPDMDNQTDNGDEGDVWQVVHNVCRKMVR